MLAAADGFWVLLAVVGVFGLAGSLIAPATRAYVGIAAGDLRPEAFGLLNIASVLGCGLSGFLSGLAATVVSPVIGWADELGWRHQTPGQARALVEGVGAPTAAALRLTSRDADAARVA
jgi:MFS family permease